MTYITWKDEVESYLVSLPQEEKQKIFSYFSEMYADKRDAGKSEEQIIGEFGAPYDVAMRILADGNYGAPQSGKELPEREVPPPAAAEQPPKKKAGVWHTVWVFTLAIFLTALSVLLIGSCIAEIVQGFIIVGAAVGGLASGNGSAAMMVINVGYGLINTGLGFLILIPFHLLVKKLWSKFKKFTSKNSCKEGDLK
ncbi:MAG: DUF1700 domain-containing protein [Roseburia sp.]|nr:DUF1700 domain-containing protein [Roseburia sp.]